MTITKRIESIEDLEAILNAQNETINGLGTLVQAMDANLRPLNATVTAQGEQIFAMRQQIKLLIELHENHQSIIQKLTGVTPPSVDPIVH